MKHSFLGIVPCALLRGLMLSLGFAVLVGAPAYSADDEHFVIAFGAEPTQLDPTRTSAGVDAYFMSLFYEQLVAIDPDLERINWLAEDWRIDERDGLPLIFVKIFR